MFLIIGREYRMKKLLFLASIVLLDTSLLQATTVKNLTSKSIEVRWKGRRYPDGGVQEAFFYGQANPGQQVSISDTEGCAIVALGDTRRYNFENLTKDTVINFDFDRSTIENGGKLVSIGANAPFRAPEP